MRTLIGLVLALTGLAVVLYGLGTALSQIAGLYGGALADPLGQPDGTEKAVADGMWRSAMIGACGLPLLIVGSAMTGRGLLGRASKRSKR